MTFLVFIHSFYDEYYYSLLYSYVGHSDSNGLSYFISFNMMPMVFVSDVFLGDNQEAYGLNFSVSIAIISTAPIKSDGIFIR